MAQEKIAIAGSSGFVGSALVQDLIQNGSQVVRLPRSVLQNGRLDEALSGCAAVVNLAGESIAEGRWTAAKKDRILTSRVNTTRKLTETLAQLKNPPAVLISASAIGYYGDRGQELLRESSGPGQLFLSRVCQEWEAAAQPAVERGIRTVFLRIGMVLGKDGGALAKMLFPFKMGVGGVIGSGAQYMSWITRDDLVGVIRFALHNTGVQGPVNAVSPHPVTNAEFTKSLGRALHRPTVFPMPAFAARLAFGEMADELLLASTRVEPAALTSTGYRFQHPRLDEALRALL